MKKEIFIVGAGNIGGHLVSNLHIYNLECSEVYFIDDNFEKMNTYHCGIKVVGNIDALLRTSKEIDVIVAIANPRLKRSITIKLKNSNKVNFPSLIAKNAWISEGVSMGEGCIIYPNCSINYGSVLSDFIILNMNCAIGHHTRIGSYSSLFPSVSTGGFTNIAENVEIGIGSITIQNINIEKNSIIGAGSVIISHVKENLRVGGVPAKELRKINIQ